MNTEAKIKYLNELFYDYDKQQTKKWRITYAFIDKNKDMRTGKWVYFLDYDPIQDKIFFNKVNQREQLKSEIILEYDPTNKKKDIAEKEFKNLLEKLKKDGINYRAFGTEDYRALRVETFWDSLGQKKREERRKIREFLINKYGCDTHFNSDNHMCSFGIHYKTNKEIKVIEEHNFKEKNKLKSINEDIKKQSHPEPPSPTQYHPVPPSTTLKEKSIFLLKERPIVNQIKCGIHKNHYYFGTIVYDSFKEPKEAIISCDIKGTKRIYVDYTSNSNLNAKNEIKDDFGLYYRYPFEFDILDNHISIDGIREFLENDISISIKELYSEILKINKEYMYYPDDISHSIVALDIISSYFLPCFQAIGRTFLEAEKGSGKTRQCTIYKILGFNSVMSADISSSAYYRLMESTCGMLVIDDFDSIGEEQKTMILQHYKTGYKNNSKSVRCGEGKTRKSDAFRNYGHVIMNNTSGLDDISADRTKFLPIIKTNSKITLKNINENSIMWKKLTDKLYQCALLNWIFVKKSYDNLSSSKLSGRPFEITRPLLCLANIISEELRENIEDFFIDRFEQQDINDPKTDFEYILFEIFFDKKEGEYLPLEEIKYIVKDKSQTELKDRGLSTYLGKKINVLLSIFKKKKIHGVLNIELKNKNAYVRYINQKKWDFAEKEKINDDWVGLKNPIEEEIVKS